MKSRSLSLLLAATLGFSGCAQYASVSERPPQLPRAGLLAAVRTQIAEALKRERRQPLLSLGEYLAAADSASEQLRRNPKNVDARNAYNFAVARVFTTIRDGRLDPWTRPLQVPSSKGSYLLTHREDRRRAWNPALYDFTPSDQFDVHGTYVTQRTIKEGLGAPLVAVGRGGRSDAREEFAPARTYYGVTAIARFGADRRVVIEFKDPLATENVDLQGYSYPLAADFTVPIAVMLARENPKRLELTRLLQPEKYAATAHIVRLQPYDPEKTVVVVVHGLMDSPATWTPMINSLRGDPYIRDHYQFWYYSYPSGYPYPYSAAIMRHELDAVERRFPLRKKIVLIGHSMGGMISRLMVTDSGDTLWLRTFGKPPSETNLSPKTKGLLEDALIFRHRSEVGRVIFISAPHRGSDLATNWAGRIGSSLVRAPRTLLSIGNEVLSAMTQDSSALRLNRIPNSIDTLAPNNRFVKAVNTIPIASGIPYHTIAGDRGRGDSPNSSDGIVPYWSSHLDGAQSELIVPSNHSAHQNPQAIKEVERILRSQR